jgi:ferredoxin
MAVDKIDGSDIGGQRKVSIDQESCTGDGLCVVCAPALFRMDSDGLAYVQDQAGKLMLEPGSQVTVPQDLLEAAEQAAADCPGSCIYLE